MVFARNPNDRLETCPTNEQILNHVGFSSENAARMTIQDIFEAGVVGAGGAGFPTHVKLAGKADTVLINAAECEPLLHKDKEVLRDYADDVIEGLAVAMRLVGASAASSASRRSTTT